MIGIIIALFSVLCWIIWTKSYYIVQEGFAYVRSGWGGEKVFFKGTFWAYPIVHHVDKINISEHRLFLDLSGKSSIICKDNIRANIQLTFFIQVNPNTWDVLKVAQSIGCERAVQRETLEQLFLAKFSEAIKTTAKNMDYLTLFNHQKEFKTNLLYVIDENLNGYQLNRISIVDVRALAFEEYDPNNILDAQGMIRYKEIFG